MSEEMAVQAVRAAFGAQAAAQAGEVTASAPEATAGQVAAFEEAMRAAGLETVPAAATVTETAAADRPAICSKWVTAWQRASPAARRSSRSLQ